MSDSKIQRAKKQCEKLKEMADEYWEMFEDYHKMELELEEVKKEVNQLKELNVALRRECDTEHIRYINAMEKAYDNMWEVAGALDINWSGQRNKDIIDAIKELKQKE